MFCAPWMQKVPTPVSPGEGGSGRDGCENCDAIASLQGEAFVIVIGDEREAPGPVVYGYL